MEKRYLDKKIVDRIKQSFPAGTKVELIKMSNDLQAVPEGTKGIVHSVDDIGTIHTRWETGSSLGLIIGKDLFKVINDEGELLDVRV